MTDKNNNTDVIFGVPNSHWDAKPLSDYLANHHEGCICNSCYHQCMHDSEMEFLSWFVRIKGDIFEWSDISGVFRSLWEYSKWIRIECVI